MPFGFLDKIEFKQPIFGANRIQFEVFPVRNLLPGKSPVRLYFKQGGCDKFLRVFEFVV